MKINVLLFFISIIAISCTNRQSSISQTSEESKNDSLLLVQKQDSIERERIFEALKDTAFSGVCFGMNKSQYKTAFNAFIKPIKIEDEFYDFEFEGLKFYDMYGSDVEKNKTKSINGYPYGLEHILKESKLGTYFYKDRLFSIVWESNKEIHSEQSVKYSLGKLVSHFEKKYGKPNVNNTERFNTTSNETDTWLPMKVIAKWETNKKKITIYYRDVSKSERDKWMDENYPSYYQYELNIQFLDKIQKKEVDEYIKPILQKFEDEYIEKMRSC